MSKKPEPLTLGFLLCWLKNINSSTYRLSSTVRAERINLSNRYIFNCINFTQQRFGLKNHRISAQQKALALIGNFIDTRINKMRFVKYKPTERLKPFIKFFAVSENEVETEYKILPSSGLVIGFQYRGQLAIIKDKTQNKLSSAGVTGISDRYKTFKNSAGIGTILTYFTETGFTQFASHPANELFNQSISLDNLFDKNKIAETEERLGNTKAEKQRIHIVEQFFLSQLKNIQTDKLIIEAVKLIYESKGNIRIKELNERLFISQSPFEKRFRKMVGTTPKKFASIVRFNAILDSLNNTKSLIEICYENNFFDQAHFIKDFKQYTGDTPEKFKRFL